MSHPYVTSAKFTGGKMTFNVLVDDFEANEYVEISGHATQTGGAFANIYEIAQVPDTANDPSVKASVDVTVDPGPNKPFLKGKAVTVVIRVAKVWVTVLGQKTQTPGTQTSPQVADEGTTWDDVREVSELYGPQSPAGAS